jgi:hypothetical protein
MRGDCCSIVHTPLVPTSLAQLLWPVVEFQIKKLLIVDVAAHYVRGERTFAATAESPFSLCSANDQQLLKCSRRDLRLVCKNI